MAIDTWDVFVTDNGEQIAEMLRGVSMIIYGDSIAGFVKSILALGLLLVAVRFVFTGGWQGTLKWFFLSSIILFGLLGPRKPVLVQDYSNPTFAAGLVDDVPIGLAAILSFTTVVGHSLVQVFETAYGTVSGFEVNNGFQYSSGGMLAAEETFERLMTMDAKDPRVIGNVNSFLSACVYPQILSEKTFDDLAEEGDFSSYFNNITSTSQVNYKPEGGPAAWKTCVEAKPLVLSDIEAEAAVRTAAVGKVIYPSLEAAAAASRFENDIGFVSDRYLSLSKTGPELVSQIMSINMIKRSVSSQASSGGDAAIMDFVNAQASLQSRTTMSSIGTLMQTALPKMHSVLIIVLIALFPIVTAIALIPGGGGGTLKGYFLFFLNLQVWPLMFSVFSRIIEGETAQQAQAMVAAANNSLTMTNLDPLAGLPSETSAIAAMMIGLIPGIAVMLTKGYGAVAGNIESTLRPINVATENASAAGATGNINLGNANLQNNSVRTSKRDDIQHSPSLDYGQNRGYTNSGAKFTVARDGGQIVDGGGAQGSSIISGQVREMNQAGFRKTRSEAETRRDTATSEHSKAMTAASASGFAAGLALLEGNNAQQVFGYDANKSAVNTLSKSAQGLKSHMEGLSVRDQQAIRTYLNGAGSAKGSVGFMGMGNGATVGGSVTLGRDEGASKLGEQLLQDYISTQQTKEQGQKFNDALNEVTSDKNSLSRGKSSNLTDTMSANLQKAESWSTRKVRAENDIESIDSAIQESSSLSSELSQNMNAAVERVLARDHDRADIREIMGTRGGNQQHMNYLRAAHQEAFNERFGGIGKPTHGEGAFAMSDGGEFTGISGEAAANHEEKAGQVSGINKANREGVAAFEKKNGALSDEEGWSFQSNENLKNWNNKRMSDTENNVSGVRNEMNGFDVTKGGSDISEYTDPYSIAGRQAAVEEWEANKEALENSMPFEAKTIDIHSATGKKVASESVWLQREPTEAEYATLGPRPSGSSMMNDSRLAAGLPSIQNSTSGLTNAISETRANRDDADVPTPDKLIGGLHELTGKAVDKLGDHLVRVSDYDE